MGKKREKRQIDRVIWGKKKKRKDRKIEHRERIKEIELDKRKQNGEIIFINNLIQYQTKYFSAPCVHYMLEKELDGLSWQSRIAVSKQFHGSKAMLRSIL